MAGNKTQPVIHLEGALRIHDHAVFVGATNVFHVVPAENDGQSAVDGLGLEACVADRPVGLCVAHDRREKEERVSPFTLVDPLTRSHHGSGHSPRP